MSFLSADHSIGIRRFSRDGRKLRDEIAFLEGDEFPAELLADLSAEAERLGTSAEAVLLARGLIDERGFYRRLAGHLGVPFFEKSHPFAMPIHWREALASGHARLADGSVLIAPRGLALVTILQNVSAQIHAERMMIAAPRDFESCVIEICGREMADAASYELAEKRPDLCARDGLGGLQKTVLALVLAVLAVGLAGEDLRMLDVSGGRFATVCRDLQFLLDRFNGRTRGWLDAHLFHSCGALSRSTYGAAADFCIARHRLSGSKMRIYLLARTG
jgi:hypothetical protein